MKIFAGFLLIVFLISGLLFFALKPGSGKAAMIRNSCENGWLAFSSNNRQLTTNH